MTDCPYIDRPVREIRERVCPLEVVWGWQGIADMMDVSHKTAIRYARDSGLPVRKVAPSGSRSVCMILDEYNQWLKTRPIIGGKGD